MGTMTRVETGTSSGVRVAALVAGLVGVLAGALITSIVHSDAAPPLELAGLEVLDRDVRELTSVLRGQSQPLPAAPVRADPASTSPAEPLHPNPSTDLTPLLTRLDALLARLDESGVAGGAPFQFPDEAALDTARRELFAADPMTTIRSHRLMTYRQIAERYGKPDSIHVSDDGTVSWRYSRDDDTGYSFSFYDGLCR
jgi:hypothetical protein